MLAISYVQNAIKSVLNAMPLEIVIPFAANALMDIQRLQEEIVASNVMLHVRPAQLQETLPIVENAQILTMKILVKLINARHASLIA